MRILTRYILKEVTTHALLWLVVFTFVIFIFTPHVTRLIELAVSHDLQARETLELLALPLPGILVLTIPMAVLVGTLIGLSRMSADGEVVAARASGLSFRQFTIPVTFLALAGLAAAAWMSLDLGPEAGAALNRRERRLAASQGTHAIQPRVFIEQFPNWLLYIQDVTGPRSELRGVFAADTSDRNAPKITLAESGLIVNDPEHGRLILHLQHGATHEIDPAHPGRYSVGSFEETDIQLPIEPSGALAEKKSPSTLPLTELVRLADSPVEKLAARVEINYRLALPFASARATGPVLALGRKVRRSPLHDVPGFYLLHSDGVGMGLRPSRQDSTPHRTLVGQCAFRRGRNPSSQAAGKVTVGNCCCVALGAGSQGQAHSPAATPRAVPSGAPEIETLGPTSPYPRPLYASRMVVLPGIDGCRFHRHLYDL